MQCLTYILTILFANAIYGNGITVTSTIKKNLTLVSSQSGRQKRSSCEPDVAIASETQVQVLKTGKDEVVLYTRQKNLKYIDVKLTFTFGQEIRRFSTERCVTDPSCWQAVRVRALRNPNGVEASKWAVELSLGSCSFYETYSHLYWVNTLYSMGILAQGSSEWYFTLRGLGCPTHVNPTHCPPVGNLDLNLHVAGAEGAASTGIGIGAACLLLLINVLVIMLLYKRLRARSESSLQLTQIGVEDDGSIVSRHAPSRSGEGNLYLPPCPRTTVGPYPVTNPPRRYPEPPLIPVGNAEGPGYLYVAIPNVRPQCPTSSCPRRPRPFLENGSQSMYDDVNKECGQGQYDDVNEDCMQVQPCVLYSNTVIERPAGKPTPRFQQTESNHYIDLTGE
ncbi:uncharacterized protein LOC125045527 [Penaeus chinensis]|uniref:uncharacterized protein LOC125045527 n=1 Tax=Penaeus chinensis TaxID=139456 RepID=UPI001FB5E227|nr:uncharacterized protein LOC125045527 [Penaeus chinensis]